MLGVALADYPNDAPARHDFAVLADGAHARTYLQQVAPEKFKMFWLSLEQ
jgi:hypothetical protein